MSSCPSPFKSASISCALFSTDQSTVSQANRSRFFGLSSWRIPFIRVELLCIFFAALVGPSLVAQTALPTVTVAAGSGTEGGAVSFVVSISEATTGDVSFKFNTSIETSDTAEANDFDAASDESETIPAGDTSVTISVSTNTDSVYDKDETFTLTISDVTPSNLATLGTASSATGTITDAGMHPVASLTAPPVTTEPTRGTAPMVFVITLDKASEEDLSFNLSRPGGQSTADNGIDYVLVTTTDLRVTFKAGETSKNFTIQVYKDLVYEHGPDETVTLALAAGQGEDAGVDPNKNEATGYIKDNEPVPVYSIDTGILEAHEGRPLNLKVVSTVGAQHPVTMSLSAVAAGEATAADFTQNVTSLTPEVYFNATVFTAVVDIEDDSMYEANDQITLTISDLEPSAAGTFGTASATFTIVDSIIRPVISVEEDEKSEEGESLTFTVKSSAVHTDDIVLTYHTEDGTADASDYSKIATESPSSLTIASGETSVDIVIDTTEDAIFEGDETFIVVLQGPSAAKAGVDLHEEKDRATATIEDDETAPKASVSAPSAAVEEGKTMTFSVELSGEADEEATVPFTIGGTASTSDYKAAPKSPVEFAAGDTSQSIEFELTDDDFHELTETITIELGTPTTAVLDSSADEATGSIADNEPKPSLSIADASIEEGKTVVLTISMVGKSQSTISGTWSTSADTATSDVDYTAVSAGTFSIPSGSLSTTISIATDDDKIYEGSESFSVTIVSKDAALASVSDATADVTITENESLPSLTIADVSVNEGAKATLTITQSPASAYTVTGTWSTSSTTTDSTTAGTDYTTVASGTYSIDSGKTSTNIEVATLDDDVYEGAETLTVSIVSSDVTEAIVTDGTATVTINDNETIPKLALEANVAADEGTDLVFDVSLSGKVAKAVTFDYKTELGSASETHATASDFSHQASAKTVTIASGSTEAEITIKTTADTLFERDETFDLVISNVNQALIGTKTKVTGTIENDDSIPTASLSASPTSVTEGDSATDRTKVTLTVTLDNESGLDAVVSIGVKADETDATLGSDYTALSASKVTVDAGDTSATASFEVLGDDLYEGDEEITILISADEDVSVGSSNSVTIEIEEDETEPVISIADVSVSERAGTVKLKVVTSEKSVEDIGLKYVTALGTAESDDFGHETTKQSLEIESGSTEVEISVAISEDNVDEGESETFLVNLSDLTPTDSTSFANGGDSATVTILDNDPTPTMSIASASEDEGKDLSFTVSITNPSEQDISFSWVTADGTASAANGDYTAQSSAKSETISAGDTSHVIKVSSATDDIDEPNETFTVTLSSTDSDVTLGTKTATGTIVDLNDNTVSLDSVSGDVTEGDDSTENKTMEFTLTLTNESAFSVSVPFSITNKTTADASDYSVESSNPVVFAPGNKSAKIEITILGDLIFEDDELIEISLGTPTHADRHATKHTLSAEIEDNENPPSITISDVSASEGASAVLKVEMDPVSEAVLTLTANTVVESDDTATSGDDFTALSDYSVEIAALQSSEQISISLIADGIDEPDETFQVTLANEGSHPMDTSGSTLTAEVEIEDSDPTPAASLLSAVTGEEGTAFEFEATLSGASSRDITLPFVTLDSSHSGTYTASSSDFSVEGSQSVVFAAGTETASLTIQTTEDLIYEPDETFGIQFTNPPSHVTIEDTVSIGTILDNDFGAELVYSDYTVDEGTTVVFEVSLSDVVPEDVSFDYLTEHGTASSNDYEHVSTAVTLTIPASSLTTSFEIEIYDDEEREETETFTIHFINHVNVQPRPDDSIEVSIVDGSPELPVISIADAKPVLEGNEVSDDNQPTLTFPISMSAVAFEDIVLSYELSGTAVPEEDFIISQDEQPLVIKAGETSSKIEILVIPDRKVEKDETLHVTLLASTNSLLDEELSQLSASSVIENDDLPAISFSSYGLTVTEGEQASYEITLISPPSEPFTLTPTLFEDADIDLSGLIEFTPQNWKEPKTVQLGTTMDEDAQPILAFVEHKPLPEKYAASDIDFVSFRVLETHTANIVLSEPMLELQERGSASYQIKLTSKPLEATMVTPLPVDGNVLSVSEPVMFTPDDWSEWQTVVVSVADNSVLVNNSTTINHKAFGPLFQESELRSMGVSIENEEVSRIALAPYSLSVLEGNSTSYSIQLSKPPGGTVSITPISSDESRVVVSDPVTFDDSNWLKRQFISVTSTDNDDMENATVSIGHESSVRLEFDGEDSVDVKVQDNDSPALVINQKYLIAREGERLSYAVSLNSAPSSDVTVEVSGGSEMFTDRTVLTERLVFSPTNWNLPQWVNVIAHADNSAKGNLKSVITHQASGGEFNATDAVEVHIWLVEDDDWSIELVTTSAQMLEGESFEYSIKLRSQPTMSVLVEPFLAPSDKHNAVISLSGPLRFTPLNWDVPQNVTVSSEHSLEFDSGEFLINHRVRGGNLRFVEQPAFTVEYLNSDEFSVAVFPSVVSLVRGESTSYQVRATADPGNPIAVLISPTEDEVLSFTNRVQFTSDNWAEPQSIDIKVFETHAAREFEPITLKHQIEDSTGQLEIQDVVVNIATDERPVLLFSQSEISIVELGSAEISLSLNDRPATEVYVQPHFHGSDSIEFDPPQLTFKTTDWSEPQTIVLRSHDDEILGVLRELIHWEVTGDEYFASAQHLTTELILFDVDIPTITSSEVRLHIEEGQSKQFDLGLSHLPMATVVVDLEVQSDLVEITPNQMTFTLEDWNTPQSVSVRAIEDDTVRDARYPISWVATGGGYEDAQRVSTEVVVLDNDAVDLQIEEGVYIHSGTLKSYHIALASKPSTRVEIKPVSQNPHLLSTTDTLYFDPLDWNEQKTVHISAAMDENAQSQYVEVNYDISGGEYGSLRVPNTKIFVMPSKERGVYIYPTEISIDEGSTATYYAVLHAPPTADVTMNAVSTDDSVLTVTDAMQFTNKGWRWKQYFEVASPADSIQEDTTVTIEHTLTGGGYDAVAADAVVVHIKNREPIVAEPNQLSLREGEQRVYSVRLTAPPDQDVVLRPVDFDEQSVQVRPESVVLTKDNWQVPQEFTVMTKGDQVQVDSATQMQIAHTLIQQGTDVVLGEGQAIVDLKITPSIESASIHATAHITSDSTATVDISLSDKPTSPVHLLLGNNVQGLEANPSYINFSPGDWHSARSLQIVATLTSQSMSRERVDAVLADSNVQSEDPRFNGIEVEIEEMNDTRHVARVTQNLLEPVTSSIARGGVSRVMDCMNIAVRERVPDDLRQYSNANNKVSDLALGAATLDGTSPGTWYSDRDRDVDASARMSDRLTFCSGVRRTDLRLQDDLSLSSRMTSSHVGGGWWVTERLLAGIDLNLEEQQLDWRDKNAPMKGTSDVRMQVLNPYVAWFSGDRSNRLWTMTSFGRGSMEVSGAHDDAVGYSLNYRAIGIGGEWQPNDQIPIALNGESWVARTHAISSDRMFASVRSQVQGGRLRVSGEWSTRLGESINLTTSLSSGLLSDSSIGTTAIENQIGLNLVQTKQGLSTGYHLRTLNSSDESIRSVTSGASISYRANFTNQRGPWFSLSLGEKQRSLLPDSTDGRLSQLSQSTASRDVVDWRIESGWNAAGKVGSFPLNPSLTYSKLRNGTGYDVSISNKLVVLKALQIESRLSSRVRREATQEPGVELLMNLNW